MRALKQDLSNIGDFRANARLFAFTRNAKTTLRQADHEYRVAHGLILSEYLNNDMSAEYSRNLYERLMDTPL